MTIWYSSASFCSYGIRRPIEDEKTDCMRLLGNLVTEIPVWDLFTKNQPKRYEQSLPTDLSFLENAFCDLRWIAFSYSFSARDIGCFCHELSSSNCSLSVSSIHYFKRESLDSPLGRQILNHRPLEKDIDEAALLDIELFGWRKEIFRKIFYLTHVAIAIFCSYEKRI